MQQLLERLQGRSAGLGVGKACVAQLLIELIDLAAHFLNLLADFFNPGKRFPVALAGKLLILPT